MSTLAAIKTIFKSRNRRRAERINRDLAAVGYSQAQIARDLGVTRTAVGQEVWGERKSKRIRDRIEHVTGKKYF